MVTPSSFHASAGRAAETSIQWRRGWPSSNITKLLRARQSKRSMKLNDLGPSKGAPVPFPRQTCGDTASLVISTLAVPFTHSFRRGIGGQTFPPRGRFNPVLFPFPVHSPTVSTSPVEPPIGMIVPVLVKGYLPHGMLATKYIPTVPAMMPSLEESKLLLADRRIAD